MEINDIVNKIINDDCIKVIEKNKDYYKTSVERLEDIKAQISLFNL